ncbi:MAG: NADH-quinone oxidoreductase subunit I [Planctomycetes bacterium]|nr:NADH-quinone oxidoreductase subunit I [Planctomycetota bacterium]
MKMGKFKMRLYLPAVAKGLWVTMRRFFSRKETVEYPDQAKVPRKGYRGEHRLKKDEQGRMKCVACFMCQTACPAECIEIVAGPSPWPDRDKIPVTFNIDMLKCIYCGMCEEACPCDAIELTPTYNIVATSRADKIYDLHKLLSR